MQRGGGSAWIEPAEALDRAGRRQALDLDRSVAQLLDRFEHTYLLDSFRLKTAENPPRQTSQWLLPTGIPASTMR